MRFIRWLVLVALCLTDAGAAETALPEPLTLEAALAAVDVNHPLVAEAEADRQAAQARRDMARAADDLAIDLSLQARRVEPDADSPYPDHDDSRAVLTLDKTLYDFGRTRAGIDAGERLLQARRIALQDRLQQLRLRIMRRYFDVILADLEAARANEAMSISFVRADNARDRLKLGEISDIDALALENTYQRDLLARERAEDRQRQTRALLALALNRPEALPEDLEMPALPGLKKPLPAFEALLKAVYRNNLTLRALEQERQSLTARIQASRADNRPNLYLRLQAAEYRRRTGLRDPLTTMLGIDLPLYRGGRTNAQVATEASALTRLQAVIRRHRYSLRQSLLEQWQAVQTLQRQLHQAEVQRDFRDLDLDRARARYDLEIDTNLGDAMTLQTAAKKFMAQTRFDLAMARERLAYLTQNPALSALKPAERIERNQEETP